MIRCIIKAVRLYTPTNIHVKWFVGLIFFCLVYFLFFLSLTLWGDFFFNFIFLMQRSKYAGMFSHHLLLFSSTSWSTWWLPLITLPFWSLRVEKTAALSFNFIFFFFWLLLFLLLFLTTARALAAPQKTTKNNRQEISRRTKCKLLIVRFFFLPFLKISREDA